MGDGEKQIVYSLFCYVFIGDPSDKSRCLGLRDEWLCAPSDEAAIGIAKEFIAGMPGRVRQLWLTPKRRRKNIYYYDRREGVVSEETPRPLDQQVRT